VTPIQSASPAAAEGIGVLAGTFSRAQVANTPKANSPETSKLVKAAGEFESMLLESLWKSMKESFTDPNDPDADPTTQSFDEWGMKSMADAVGNAGGLGIKNMIIKYLEPTIPADVSVQPPKKLS
jgi:Rod binding domain-containing protein